MLIHLFVCSIVGSFVGLFICWFVHLFVHLLVCSFVRSFVGLVSRSVISNSFHFQQADILRRFIHLLIHLHKCCITSVQLILCCYTVLVMCVCVVARRRVAGNGGLRRCHKDQPLAH